MIKLLKAFGFALNGLFVFFRYETNGRIQGVVAVAVVALSAWLKISPHEWIVVLTCIALVIGLEMINSAIEKVCNLISAEFHPTIKIIKDICAGAVLWATIFSIIMGCIIFLPKIFS